MAIVQNPITGRTRGKFSTAVFSKQFGKNTMRSKALSVRNPRSPEQLDQRAKFNVALAFVRSVISIVRVGYAKFASGMSAYNACMRQVMLEAIGGSYPNYDITYADVMLAQGPLTGFSAPSAIAAAGKKINFAWTDNTGQGNASDSDIFCYGILNKDSGEVYSGVSARTRKDGSLSVTTSAQANDKVEVYGFFISATTGEASDSVYLMEHTIVA